MSAVSDLSSRWLVQARGEVGGFDVGSELTWQLLGAFGYRFNDSWDVRAGSISEHLAPWGDIQPGRPFDLLRGRTLACARESTGPGPAPVAPKSTQ